MSPHLRPWITKVANPQTDRPEIRRGGIFEGARKGSGLGPPVRASGARPQAAELSKIRQKSEKFFSADPRVPSGRGGPPLSFDTPPAPLRPPLTERANGRAGSDGTGGEGGFRERRIRRGGSRPPRAHRRASEKFKNS